MAIPLNYYNYTDNTSFAGIATFKIDLLQGITENGSVQHNDFIPADECIKSGDAVKADDTFCAYYSGNILPDRSVIMRDVETDSRYLYSVSQLGIKANDLNLMSDTLGSLKVVP